MATIKINYRGTTYSMVKTPSKVVTPSVYVDGGYIPCFKGDMFGEVVNGNSIYTLSPLMVNGYRLACGRRNVSIRVYGHFWLYGNFIMQVGISSFRYQCMLQELFVTDQNNNRLSGFSASASGFYWYDTNQVIGVKSSDDVTYSGDIDVSYNGTRVLSTPYSVNIPIWSYGLNGGERVEHRNILLASSN